MSLVKRFLGDLSVKNNVILLAVSLLVTFSLLEVALRITGRPHGESYDDSRVYNDDIREIIKGRIRRL